jgi:hypothetical protein
VFGLVVVVWGGIWPGCCHVYIWPYCCHIISDPARIVDLAWCVVICGIYMYMATFSVAVRGIHDVFDCMHSWMHHHEIVPVSSEIHVRA